MPTEKEDASTTTVALTVPDGFSIDSFAAAPGWKRDGSADGLGRGCRRPEGDLDGREHRAGRRRAGGRGRGLPVPRPARVGEDLRVPGRADLLRRLGRRLVRAGGLRHAGADTSRRSARSAAETAVATTARRSRSSRSSIAVIGLVLGGIALARREWAESDVTARPVAPFRLLVARRARRCRRRRSRTPTSCAPCRRRAGSWRGSPPRVALTFSEAVEPRFAIVSVTDAAGNQVTDGRPVRSPADANTLLVPAEAPVGGLVPRLLAGDLRRRPSGPRRLHVPGRSEPRPGAAVPGAVDLRDRGDAEARCGALGRLPRGDGRDRPLRAADRDRAARSCGGSQGRALRPLSIAFGDRRGGRARSRSRSTSCSRPPRSRCARRRDSARSCR